MPASRSGTPTSAKNRTAEPYRPIWFTVWLAPVPRSSGGRSAVSTMRLTPLWSASSTAGWKFAAAVPEVHTSATGRREARARPTARKDAERSSMRTWVRIRVSATRAKASGVEREPGAITASVSPSRASSSTRTRASAVDGFMRTLSPQDLLASRIREHLDTAPRCSGRLSPERHHEPTVTNPRICPRVDRFVTGTGPSPALVSAAAACHRRAPP